MVLNMPKWSEFNLTGKKAQFFIISMVIVVSILASVSGLLNDYYKTGISQSAELSEADFFWNVKSQVNKTIVESSDEERARNFYDFVLLAEESAGNKGMDLKIENTTSLDSKPVNISIFLYSTNIAIEDETTYP